MNAHTHTSSGAVIAAQGEGHADGHHHISSLRLLGGVLVALLVLTALTVYTAREVNLGESGNLIVALAIASVKATLVGAFFMHLLHDKRLNAIVMFFCFIAVATFLMFTIIDLGSRDAVDPVRNVWDREPTIVQDAHDNAQAAEGSVGEPAPADDGH